MEEEMRLKLVQTAQLRWYYQLKHVSRDVKGGGHLFKLAELRRNRRRERVRVEPEAVAHPDELSKLSRNCQREQVRTEGEAGVHQGEQAELGWHRSREPVFGDVDVCQPGEETQLGWDCAGTALASQVYEVVALIGSPVGSGTALTVPGAMRAVRVVTKTAALTLTARAFPPERTRALGLPLVLPVRNAR
eukprot:CAMPEP_0119468384 /NCGR_PEP_ID=MMETSP1344-20130328/2161_1 /TAXON_ID=236787 /ORGANISM="Florenciella parvula, Strain CCMP2471" /LENGTH=189 /DNA_ID=CAMNT_0007500849 /DNA_START=250 /DNA_END=820 /DNA_ORIENTATION=-